MQVMIFGHRDEDLDEYSYIGAEALAIWPQTLDITEDRMIKVAENYRGETMQPDEVMRLLGH